MKDKEDIEETKEEEKEINTGFINFIITIIIIVVLIVFYASFFGTKGLSVREYRVNSNILTSNFDGLKIVHFSDLLYKSTIDLDDVKSLVKRINELEPDIVVFTGNLVSSEANIREEDGLILINELYDINAKIGKYAIYGDTDYSYDDYDKVMSSSNFEILTNEYKEINYLTEDSLYIVGLPSSIKYNIDLDESFKFYDDLDRKYIIVLVNNGKTIKYIDDSNYEVDLILGGYSLNGSVRFPIIGGLFKDSNSYKYFDSEYKKGITNIYISGGLGTRKYGYRLFNHPSFNFYRLKSQS